MAITLLSASTGPATSDEFQLKLSDLPAQIISEGLGTGDTIDLQVKGLSGFNPVYKSGNAVQLTMTNTVIAITEPGKYKVDKDTTDSASVILEYGNSI